ncbi:hypothetical protein GCM10023153_22330 [Ornithinibacter aureus]|uniref:Uncharacterized protein n=1 Tax=Ornithinibacter aureus TaxID=622664 RepID=A0ABP8JZ91_9MICO|nr:hypothetical protein [Ornithinibacter aureus]KAF0834674.1 hypothetical protein C8E84_2508 [Ornithinibacter aureus]
MRREGDHAASLAREFRLLVAPALGSWAKVLQLLVLLGAVAVLILVVVISVSIAVGGVGFASGFVRQGIVSL